MTNRRQPPPTVGPSPPRCLEEHIDNTDMSKECKDEVTRDMNRMAHDHRLNWRLNNACEADTAKLCSNLCSSSPGASCGGLVLQCLQVGLGASCITSQACQDEASTKSSTGISVLTQLCFWHGMPSLLQDKQENITS